MAISITTKNFVKTKKVLIDGMEWDYTAPGAGMALELSKLAREITTTKASDEKQTEMVEKMFEYYASMFTDSTKGNTQVKKWLRDTPIDVIGLVVAEVQKQSE